LYFGINFETLTKIKNMKKLIFSVAVLALAYLPSNAQTTNIPTEVRKEATGTRVNKTEQSTLPAPALKPTISNQSQQSAKPASSNVEKTPSSLPQTPPARNNETPSKKIKGSKNSKKVGNRDVRQKNTEDKKSSQTRENLR
jgi:hypothetical protein